MTATTRKKYVTQLNQRLIIDAANTLFLKQGIEKTRMDDIARAIGCSKSTLYSYFRSKDEIFHFIILDGMSLLKESLNTLYIQSTSFTDYFHGLGRILNDLYEAYPLYFTGLTGHIALETNAEVSGEITDRIYQMGEQINGQVVTRINQAIEAGEVTTDLPPLELMFVYWAAITGLIQTLHIKQAYLQKRMSTTPKKMLEQGMQLLLVALVGQS